MASALEERGNMILITTNSSYPLHLYLLDDGEEFFIHHETWDKETVRQPRIIPAGQMFYEVMIKKEIHKDGNIGQCINDPSYLRGGKI